MSIWYKAREELRPTGEPTGIWRFTMADGTSIFTMPCCQIASGCPGHATAAEAGRHYHEYALQHAQFRTANDELRHCLICDEWTLGRALPDDPFVDEIAVCAQHANTGDMVAALDRIYSDARWG